MDVTSIAQGYGMGIVVRRWAATWIDLLIAPGSLLFFDLVLGNELYQSTLPLWLLLIAAYFPLTEGLTGRTLGKWALGLKVVRRDGQLPGLGKALLRTLLRLVEVNPFLLGGLIAGVVVLASKNRQRLGDMVADTYVVRVADLRAAAG